MVHSDRISKGIPPSTVEYGVEYGIDVDFMTSRTKMNLLAEICELFLR